MSKWIQRLLQRRVRGAYRRVFGSSDGRIVLADLAKFCGIDRDLHVPGDVAGTENNVGKFRVLQRIRAMSSLSIEQVDDAVRATVAGDRELANAEAGNDPLSDGD